MKTRKAREREDSAELMGVPGQKYHFRKRPHKSIFETYKSREGDFEDMLAPGDEEDYVTSSQNCRKRNRKRRGSKHSGVSQDELDPALHYQQRSIFDRLPNDPRALAFILNETKKKIKNYKTEFLKQQSELKQQKSYAPQNSIPISADVRNFDWSRFIAKQMEYGQRAFDVILMDPPWKLSSSQPSRGVAIQYDSLADEQILKIPITKLQKDGFLMIWCINAKFNLTLELMEKWGYKPMDTVSWVKMTVNGKIAKGHGFYLQHAKETCVIGYKGNPRFVGSVVRDAIFSERRGQSQKPTELYQYIEQLVPNGFYLEIFGRRNNLRDGWVTIGNEI